MTSIAICGAGPVGLTLARLLEKAGIPSLKITVFEKDESEHTRFYQGGSLDLHPKTGLAAIREAGLWDEFSKHARYEGEELYVADKNATTYVHMTDAPQIEGFDSRPEIDREQLKQLLLHSVKPQTIQWGKKVHSIDETAGILTFADGSQAGPFDLVVGAEGAWSKVRSIVSSAVPTYSGICGLEGTINAESAGKHWDVLSKRAGQGSYFSFSGGKSLMVQRQGNGSLKVGTWLPYSENWPAAVIEQADGEEAKIRATLVAEYTGWDDDLVDWIRCSHRFRAWPLYELPVGHSWEHKKGWTLIGDAAHVMTPFAGKGVNTGMRDSLDLANEIIRALQTSETTLDQAVAAYEQALFPRATEVQAETAFNKRGMFKEDAPVGFLADMISNVGKELGHDTNKGVLAWLPIRRTAYAIFWTIGIFGALRRRIRNTFFLRSIR